jgi:hypothetical protein
MECRARYAMDAGFLCLTTKSPGALVRLTKKSKIHLYMIDLTMDNHTHWMPSILPVKRDSGGGDKK